jgi:hypothetical protein
MTLWSIAEMNPGRILFSLFFIAQLGGCTNVPTASCNAPEQERYCAKGMYLAKESERAREAQQAKEPAPTSETGPVQDQAKQQWRPIAPERARSSRNELPQVAQPVAPSTSIMRRQSVPQTAAPAIPGAPSPVTSCDAGGCWGSNANRYSGGAGGTYIDNSGRPCHRSGSWMQCF